MIYSILKISDPFSSAVSRSCSNEAVTPVSWCHHYFNIATLPANCGYPASIRRSYSTSKNGHRNKSQYFSVEKSSYHFGKKYISALRFLADMENK